MIFNLSFGVFIVSIMVALTSAAKLPAATYIFSDAVVIFGIATVCAILALFRLFKHHPLTSAEALELELMQSGEQSPKVLLRNLVTDLEQFEPALATASQEEILNAIQQMQKNYVLPFVMQQSRLYKRLGPQLRTEAFFAIAHGERLLNRVRSAASDGCLEEVYVIYPKLLTAFREANQQCCLQGDHVAPPPIC